MTLIIFGTIEAVKAFKVGVQIDPGEYYTR